jgi:hypothetical protein
MKNIMKMRILIIIIFILCLNFVNAEKLTSDNIIIIEPYCGDDTCDLNEACYTCDQDCGKCVRINGKIPISLSPSSNWWDDLLKLFIPRV